MQQVDRLIHGREWFDQSTNVWKVNIKMRKRRRNRRRVVVLNLRWTGLGWEGREIMEKGRDGIVLFMGG